MTPEATVEDVFGDLPSLETERFLLRKMRLDDAGDLFEYASDPEVARYTTWEAHKTIEVSRTVLSHWMDLYSGSQVAPWGVEHTGSRFLQLLESRLVERRVSEYFCYVHARNEIGKGFYLKSGFVHDAAHDKDDEWCMRRTLARPGGNARPGGHIP